MNKEKLLGRSNNGYDWSVPVVDHEFLHSQEGFVADVGVLVGHVLHDKMLASQLFNDAAWRRRTKTQGGLLVKAGAIIPTIDQRVRVGILPWSIHRYS